MAVLGVSGARVSSSTARCSQGASTSDPPSYLCTARRYLSTDSGPTIAVDGDGSADNWQSRGPMLGMVFSGCGERLCTVHRQDERVCCATGRTPACGGIVVGRGDGIGERARRSIHVDGGGKRR